MFFHESDLYVAHRAPEPDNTHGDAQLYKKDQRGFKIRNLHGLLCKVSVIFERRADE